MVVDAERVQQLIENRKQRTQARHDFAVKHGFAYRRAQYFKNCMVIRWKTSKTKYEINYPRIEEYTRISHDLLDKYHLWDKIDLFLDSELRLVEAGIYCFTECDHPTWAIPNEFNGIQDYVLSHLPKWAKVTRKSITRRDRHGNAWYKL